MALPDPRGGNAELVVWPCQLLVAQAEHTRRMALVFDERVRNLLDGTSFAVLATLMPDGSPQTSVIWIGRAGDVLVFTTHDLRLKARNLRRDPRASVTLFALDDPYNTVDVRGTVELVPDPERALSIELTRKYTGEDPPPDPPGSSRLIARLTPARITGMVAD